MRCPGIALPNVSRKKNGQGRRSWCLHERELQQQDTVCSRAVVRANPHAEVRAVVRAKLCAEKMAPMQKSLQKWIAETGAETGLTGAFYHIGIINVSYCYNNCSLKYKIAPLQKHLQKSMQKNGSDADTFAKQ